VRPSITLGTNGAGGRSEAGLDPLQIASRPCLDVVGAVARKDSGDGDRGGQGDLDMAEVERLASMQRPSRSVAQ